MMAYAGRYTRRRRFSNVTLHINIGDGPRLAIRLDKAIDPVRVSRLVQGVLTPLRGTVIDLAELSGFKLDSIFGWTARIPRTGSDCTVDRDGNRCQGGVLHASAWSSAAY